MSDFDPDAYLAQKAPQGGFDPDAYLAQKGGFDPDSYLAQKGPAVPSTLERMQTLPSMGYPIGAPQTPKEDILPQAGLALGSTLGPEAAGMGLAAGDIASHKLGWKPKVPYAPGQEPIDPTEVMKNMALGYGLEQIGPAASKVGKGIYEYGLAPLIEEGSQWGKKPAQWLYEHGIRGFGLEGQMEKGIGAHEANVKTLEDMAQGKIREDKYDVPTYEPPDLVKKEVQYTPVKSETAPWKGTPKGGETVFPGESTQLGQPLQSQEVKPSEQFEMNFPNSSSENQLKLTEHEIQPDLFGQKTPPNALRSLQDLIYTPTASGKQINMGPDEMGHNAQNEFPFMKDTQQQGMDLPVIEKKPMPSFDVTHPNSNNQYQMELPLTKTKISAAGPVQTSTFYGPEQTPPEYAGTQSFGPQGAQPQNVKDKYFAYLNKERGKDNIDDETLARLTKEASNLGSQNPNPTLQEMHTWRTKNDQANKAAYRVAGTNTPEQDARRVLSGMLNDEIDRAAEEALPGVGAALKEERMQQGTGIDAKKGLPAPKDLTPTDVMNMSVKRMAMKALRAPEIMSGAGYNLRKLGEILQSGPVAGMAAPALQGSLPVLQNNVNTLQSMTNRKRKKQ